MKNFKEFLTEAKDPPMLLTLRRQGIRNFPNGDRVALFSNPQLNIQLAIPYDFKTGNLKSSNVKPIKENEDFEDKDDRVEELQSAYEKLNSKKELSELECALFNWLSSEIEEFGEFYEMDDETFDDVYDDYKALTESHIVERRHRKFSSFADWHDHATKKSKNRAKFKIHKNGDLTSAFFDGKHMGSFHHHRRYGDLFESVIHHLNRIVTTGEEEEVKFSNGDTLRVHPVTAQMVVNLYNKVNDGNQRKISQMIHSGPAGLVKVADFAQEQLKRGDT
jgi:hypothetical protein